MITLQSVVDTTTPFVPCQYLVQQNSGFDLNLVINASQESNFAYSIDKPPGRKSSTVFVPVTHPRSAPCCAISAHTCAERVASFVPRAPPLH